MYGWTVGSITSREWADTPDGKQKRFLHSPVSPNTFAHAWHSVLFSAVTFAVCAVCTRTNVMVVLISA